MKDHAPCAQVGVALFRDHPNALFPFSEMDRGQRYYVEQVVCSCIRQYDISSRTTNHIVMQMGGGCVLYTEPQGMHTVHGVFQSSSGGSSKKNRQQQPQNAGGASDALRRSGGDGGQLSGPRLLKARDVFEALCDCIYASKRCVCACVCVCRKG